MAKEVVEQSFAVKETARLKLSNIRGEVRVTPGNEDVIHVKAVRDLNNGDHERTEIRMEQEADGSVLVETRYETVSGWFGGRKPGKIDYIVQTPRSCRLNLSCVSSACFVESIQGSIDVKSVSGPVRLRRLSGRIFVNSVSGRIEGLGLAGHLDVDAVSAGSVLEESHLASVKSSTVSGDFLLNGSLSEGPYVFHTVSGDVKLRITGSSGCTVKTHSISGRMHTDIPHTLQHKHGNSLHAELNGGGPLVRFNSISGDLRIEHNGDPQSSESSHNEQVASTLEILGEIERGTISVEEGLELLQAR